MILGIDLGTTNSLCSVWHDGESQLIPNSLGEYLTPSVVSIDSSNNIIVGSPAKHKLTTHPDQTVGCFKRYMGSNHKFSLSGKEYLPEELSALLLNVLKQDAELYLGEQVSDVIISVPAYFNNQQRESTKLAAKLAGLSVVRLINEPTAAALAYGLHHGHDGCRFLVFDLGGGTFDVSIMELFEGLMEVHSSAGDSFLGGEDFVDVIESEFLKSLNLDIDQLTRKQRAILRNQCENAKRQINTLHSVEIVVPHSAAVWRWRLESDTYEKIAAPLLDRLRLPVERAMRDAKLQLQDIDEVILVGGSTRKSIVQRLVARFFGRLPLRQINPDEVVALGAAVQAGLQMKDAALDDVVMTDVCPYTLGIETVTIKENNKLLEGLFSPVIERNTIIPCSRVETFFPVEDGQILIRLNVYQGESRLVADNILLGQLDVPLPELSKSQAGVDVRFTYDSNGLLEVEAKVQATDKKQQLILKQLAGNLTEEEIQQRLTNLQSLKVHPREQSANLDTMNRALRLYEERLGEDREYVGQLIERFSMVFDTQDPVEIERFRKRMIKVLDDIESSIL